MTDVLIPGAVCEMGKIKIGTLDKPRNGFNPPVRLDHFIITTLDRDNDGILIPDVPLMESLAEYRDGDAASKLRSIPIMFASNVISDCLQVRYEWWPGKSRIGAASDNLIVGDHSAGGSETRVTWYCDPRTGQPFEKPIVRDWDEEDLSLMSRDKKGNETSLLKLSATLNVMIASTAASFGGVYRFRTKSWHSTNQLLGSLQLIKRLTCGILRGPVFRLAVRPKIVRPNGIVSTAQVVHVECVGNDLKQLREEAREYTRYERENIQMIRETEESFRQLGAHVDEEPDEEIVQPKPERAPIAPAAKKSIAEQQAAAIGEIEHALGAETVEEIASFWASDRFKGLFAILAEDQKQAIVALKNQKKAAIGDESSESHDALMAGAAIVNEINRLAAERYGSWEAARTEHAAEIGFDGSRAKDMTAAQALAMHGLLTQSE